MVNVSPPQGQPDPLSRHPRHDLQAAGHGDPDENVHEEREGVREQGQAHAPGHHRQDLLIPRPAVKWTSVKYCSEI